MVNKVKLGIFFAIVALGAVVFYFFAPLTYIVNLDPLTLDLVFIGILLGFVLVGSSIQEGIGRDKESKETIKESKKI